MTTLWVPGKPQAKQRPRFKRRGRRTYVYTPDETLEYEAKVAEAWKNLDVDPVEGAVYVDLEFSTAGVLIVVLPMESTKTKLLGDVDNLSKSVLDGLQKGNAFKNDKQVQRLYALKQ